VTWPNKLKQPTISRQNFKEGVQKPEGKPPRQFVNGKKAPKGERVRNLSAHRALEPTQKSRPLRWEEPNKQGLTEGSSGKTGNTGEIAKGIHNLGGSGASSIKEG